ncbi:bpX5 domain-containing protein [Pseudomonas sp. 1152_12]|uniref:bpX5 domain-containing protein n=1 Tax=Pseudomonas sp. 1152_12 TaxID=2604455 RepID=UPI0040640A33
MSAGSQTWAWRPRQVPADPEAAVAWGDVARRLHARLLLLADEQAARLHATANGDVLVVTGAAVDLPWVDGVEYAAAHPGAPGVWLPTSWEPTVPVDVLGQTLSTRFKRSPLLLWRAPQAVVPLDRLLPVSVEHLQRIATYWGASDATA